MYEALRDLTQDELRRGIKSFCLLQKEIYPGTNVIAVIRDYALSDPKEKSAEEAWGEVVKEKCRAFIYGERKIENPLAEEAVKIMGWRNLCLSENEEADRAHFFKIYKQLSESRKRHRILGL